MIDPKRHADDRGFIESILRYVPGFRGYLEKSYRQESDHLLRKWMADRLQQSKRALDDYMLSLVNAGKIDQLSACDRAKNQLDGLILRMRAAVRGYSGFFDFVQVDVGLLERVYDHDVAVVKEVEQLATSIEQLATKPDLSEAVATELLKRIGDVDKRFAQRGEMLAGLGPA
jgi:hypothetical protein